MKSLALFIVLTLSLGGIAYADDDLAHVAIIDYTNSTGSKNYDYLGKSLSDSINSSMKKKFEFLRFQPEATQTQANSMVTGSRLASEPSIRLLAKQTDNDMVVFGNYTFNETDKKMTINTRIYLGAGKVKSVETVVTPVDASLFSAIDRVAVLIVKEITQVAKSQLSDSSKAKPDPNSGIKESKKSKLKISRKKDSKGKSKLSFREELSMFNNIVGGIKYGGTKYWRGYNFYGENHPYLSPYGTLYMLDYRLKLNVAWKNPYGNFPATLKGKDAYAEINPSFSYRTEAWRQLTIFGEVQYFYNSKDTSIQNNDSFDQSFMTIGARIALFSKLSTSISFDSYFDDYAATRSTIGDFYWNIEFHDRLATFSVLRGLNLSYSLKAGYFNQESLDNTKTTNIDESRAGFSDISAHLLLNLYTGLKGFTVYSSVNLAYLPESAWQTANANATNIFWLDLGARYAF